MKILQISSVPLMELIQKACETLVVDNCINLGHIYNVADRQTLLNENNRAIEMVEHIRDLIKENNNDASNPKS